MSAPPRGPHGGGTTSGRSTPSPGSRGRGAGQGSSSGQFRGRGGRGRGAPSATNPKAEGLLQGLQTGNLNKRGDSSSVRAGRGETMPSILRKRLEMCSRPGLERHVLSQTRQLPSTICLPSKGRSSTLRGPSRSIRGRGTMANRASAPSVQSSTTTARANPLHKDFMTEMTAKFQDLKQRREGERAKAIRDGFLADPDKKTSLDKAITPVGTCTDMCPQFERVERIVQNMVEKPEKIPNEATGRDMPAEERMVKRFRRSAAGYDEQLPSDIRTPATLKATLNYLLDDVIGGGEQLAAVHKFVWDRTRGIRNDFSIQQVSKEEDVRFAVDCFERIARFHILSSHQLSNPDNLTGDGFDAHQEREQLNNTLLSLMYYYDDNRGKLTFPNEAEFRAYCIIFELQSSHPDLEDRMQSWPPQLLNDKRVQTAFRLYSAATNTLFEQGPLKPTAPFSIAQANSGAFWKLLKSKAVSYLMSCVAEIYFGQVRYMALQNLWESHKGPLGQQTRNQEWTLDELTDALAFDDGEQTLEFCRGYGLEFKTSAEGIYHLDFTSQSSPLDQSFTPSKQVFSYNIVEAKRYRRSLVAVINGIGVARAIREGLIEADPQQDGEQSNTMDEDSSEALFFPEESTPPSSSSETRSTSIFNPEASSFTPGATTQPSWPTSTGSFGKPSAFTPFAPSTSTSSTPTGITQSGSLFPSFLPTSSITTSGLGMGSTPVTNPFQPKVQPLATSSTSSTTATAPFQFPDFKFGQPTSTNPPPASTSSPFSFGKPSTVPPTFVEPSAQQQGKGQEQISPLENHSDTPLFVSRFPHTPMPTTFTSNPPEKTNEAFPLPEADKKSLDRSPSPPSQQSQQENRDAAPNRPTTSQEAIPAPRGWLGDVNEEPIPSKPPPSPQPTQLEVPEDLAKAVPLFPSLKTGSGFRFESPFITSSTSHVLPPRDTETNTTQPPTTAAFAPKPLPSFESISRPPPIPSSSTYTQLQPLSLNTPAPSVAETSNSRVPNVPGSPTLLPSQYPAPPVPPKARKSIQPQPKHKELKAISQHDPTPRASSPLRERPVIFGDHGNAFRQSAALGNPPAPKPAVSWHDQDTAAETIARLSILQPAGLMQEYLQFIVPDLLKPIMQHHEREKPILAARAARHQILAKKYFNRWKAVHYRRVRNRQGREQRQRRLKALEQERQRRMRGDAELEAILHAKKEKERIQAEMLARSTNESNQSSPTEESSEVARQSTIPRITGQKRKGIYVDDAETLKSRETPRKIAKGHSRSRTMGSADELFYSSKSATRQTSTSKTTPQSRSSIYSGRSVLNPSGASEDLRRSLSGWKDTTRTDYFRLKALGIDPDTPVVPDTKTSLERKRNREEENAIAASRTRARTLSSTARPPVPQFSPQGARAIETSSLHQSRTPPNAAPYKATTPPAAMVDSDDDLLRQARKVRETMSEGAEWYKTYAVNIEKEVEEHEELRRSLSQASTTSSPHPSASGLAMVNGYEYLPGPEIPGRSLSRTEQRIRRTGAHGLATKPIGGSGDYLAVAMSRESAAKLNVEKQSRSLTDVLRSTEKTKKGKRKMGEKDGRYVPQHSDEDSEELDDDAELDRVHRQRQPCTNGRGRATEAKHLLPQPDEEVAEDDDDVQESLEQPQDTGYDQFEGGDTEDLYEDDDDDEELYDEDEDGEERDADDEEEEEEADGVGSLPYRQGQKVHGQPLGYWLRSSVTPERGLTPNGGGAQMMSRASSGMGTGTGASVDDALVLDSD